MESCKLEDYFSKEDGQKMITAQECLQMKRDMEAENQSDFEASPLALCMMITLLLFGIGLWIWLISWGCFFGEKLENILLKEKKKEEKIEEKKEKKMRDTIEEKKDGKRVRLMGGKMNRPNYKEVSFSNSSNNDISELSIRSRILRNCNPINYNYISHPVLSREGQTSSQTQTVEAPTTYGTTASSLTKESSKSPKKYKIQWTKLLKLGRREDSEN
ncbi:hypothetical protein KR200_003003 [Drosophila serrata]|nr:hypothetical protein KR200_003003 [Drosophila serrata]